MIARVLVDTGPLVAIVSKRDQFHEPCVASLRQIESPLYTCWPVITEALWLLRANPAAIRNLLKKFDGSSLALLPMDENSLPWINRFMRRYATAGPQLADACLMYLAEHQDFETIFTVDRRDFTIYRLRGNHAVQLIP